MHGVGQKVWKGKPEEKIVEDARQLLITGTGRETVDMGKRTNPCSEPNKGSVPVGTRLDTALKTKADVPGVDLPMAVKAEDDPVASETRVSSPAVPSGSSSLVGEGRPLDGKGNGEGVDSGAFPNPDEDPSALADYDPVTAEMNRMARTILYGKESANGVTIENQGDPKDVIDEGDVKDVTKAKDPLTTRDHVDEPDSNTTRQHSTDDHMMPQQDSSKSIEACNYTDGLVPEVKTGPTGSNASGQRITDEAALAEELQHDAHKASQKPKFRGDAVAGEGADRMHLGPLGLKVGDHKVLGVVGPQEWVEVEVTSDSGACETVMPKHVCRHIPIVDSLGSMRGDEYEAANGATIPNLGERRCDARTAGSNRAKDIIFQVADVHKPFLSTAKAADAGYDTYYGKDGGHMAHRDTGDTIPIYRRGDLYYVKFWLRTIPEQEREARVPMLRQRRRRSAHRQKGGGRLE